MNTSEDLRLSDIYNEKLREEILLYDRAPAVKEVIFDVKKYLKDILSIHASKLKTDSWKLFSLTDARNFRLTNLDEIKELFNICYNIDIESEEWIRLVNSIFQETKNIFTWRYHKVLSANVSKKEINSIKDIQGIFKMTWDTKDGITYCALAKLFRTSTTLTNDIRLKYKNKIHNEIITDITKMIWNPLEISSNEIEWDINTWNINIPIRLIHRYKDNMSTIWKAIWNINYDTIDDYRDLHWFTFEVDSENEEDYIKVMHQTYWSLSYKIIHWSEDIQIKIENKWLITMVKNKNWDIYSPTLNKMLEEWKITREFYELCNIWFIESYKETDNKKISKLSASSYQDAKFEIMYETEDPSDIGNKNKRILSWTEIKIVKKWNNNDRWLAFHPIYWYAKLFRELSRLVWYIRHSDIIHFVNDFFIKLDHNLKIKWLKKWEFMLDLFNDLQIKWFISQSTKYKPYNIDVEKEIKIWLFKYYESWLLKVKSTDWRNSNYYIHESYKELVPELQPKLEEVIS